MRKRYLRVGNASAACLALALLVSASGCKKKVPPPPPPPVTNTTPPSTPPAQKPVINSFTAEPSRIERGQSATLRWSISNATDMTIDQGVGPVQSQGTRTITPVSTTTYSLIANGPSGSDTRSVTVEVSGAPPPPLASSNVPRLSGAEILTQQGEDAYFGYDKSDLDGQARDALNKDAGLLKQIFSTDPNFGVIIEGHCDERGSAEYNLALGDRRATAAREYLVQLGIAGDKLRTISYGKEKPQCTEATEECYHRNRRAHLAAGQ